MNSSRENAKNETQRSDYSGWAGRKAAPKERFLDKLGERLVFERAAVRLYESLLAKYDRDTDKESLPPIELLRQFHREEQAHREMLSKVIRKSGGDPEVITPSANIELVANHGWALVMQDPRTTFEECLHIIQLLELADGDGWELLIELAEASGMNEFIEEFRSACAQEENHLVNVKNWSRATIERKFIEENDQHRH
ncbi:MAG: ferritin-like domain-containing protein [Bacteriovoracaceae bacterium]